MVICNFGVRLSIDASTQIVFPITEYTQAGVYLSLNERFYPNNSEIPITLIGHTGDYALKCTTDRVPCCRQVINGISMILMGMWVSPEGIEIPNQSENGPFFRSRGINDGTVNLNRLNNSIVEPFGLFCCVVPDVDEVSQTQCVNIGETASKNLTL